MEEITKEIRLINECLNGNVEAFRDLVMTYQTAVYATAFYYVKNSNIAKEIVQEAFINAYKNLHQLRDLTKFGSWLKEITTRISFQYIQKKKEIGNDRVEGKIIPISSEKLDGKNPSLSFEEIKFAIQQLPERYRLPVVLKFLEGMNYEEISRFTGESPGEIKGILQRAVKQLQKIFDNIDGESKQWQDVHK
ncbi:MAG TPA: RNA polymerase sigma factor [Candidatus Hydrogenedens sp.]|nr:RNA polymerase sigma factor [Candidatus Hydrogenedens sp.]